jgi:hypothetical protein
MKYAIGIAILMTLAGVAMKAQQHAPAIETCKADVALWDSREDRTEYMRADRAPPRRCTEPNQHFQVSLDRTDREAG